ncbi:MAG: CSLREA domain-containing protein [Rhodanobacteraceae bacterium]|nr:CSLREA domain-containing protein [Rhodanobacteraceae bacterium]
MLRLFLLIFALGLDGAVAATFTVTSTADTAGSSCGATCTLRQAITAANATAAADTIAFNLAGSEPQRIVVASNLPTIAQPPVDRRLHAGRYPPEHPERRRQQCRDPHLAGCRARARERRSGAGGVFSRRQHPRPGGDRLRAARHRLRRNQYRQCLRRRDRRSGRRQLPRSRSARPRRGRIFPPSERQLRFKRADRWCGSRRAQRDRRWRHRSDLGKQWFRCRGRRQPHRSRPHRLAGAWQQRHRDRGQHQCHGKPGAAAREPHRQRGRRYRGPTRQPRGDRRKPLRRLRLADRPERRRRYGERRQRWRHRWQQPAELPGIDARQARLRFPAGGRLAGPPGGQHGAAVPDHAVCVRQLRCLRPRPGRARARIAADLAGQWRQRDLLDHPERHRAAVPGHCDHRRRHRFGIQQQRDVGLPGGQRESDRAAGQQYRDQRSRLVARCDGTGQYRVRCQHHRLQHPRQRPAPDPERRPAAGAAASHDRWLHPARFQPQHLASGASNAQLRIVVNASGEGNGSAALALAQRTILRGLAIIEIPDGARGSQPTGSSRGSRVEGCFIGLDPSGNFTGATTGDGITAGAQIQVGGTRAEQRNVFGGVDLAFGVFINGINNSVVQGNLIGTARTEPACATSAAACASARQERRSATCTSAALCRGSRTGSPIRRPTVARSGSFKAQVR